MHKIGILSDTHNLLRESVTDILSTCDVILHGGDFSSPQILEQLNSIAPVYAVRGNTDKEWAEKLPLSLSVELFGIKIFMIHNKKMIQGGIRDRHLIICGHSHKYEHLQKDGQTWLNPGSCGRRRFSLPVTMAVLSIPEPDSEPLSGSLPDTPKNPADTSCSSPVQTAGCLTPDCPLYQIQRIQLSPDGTSADKNTSLPSLPVQNMKQTVLRVMKETDKGKSVQDIAKICHISEELSSQICRLYLTHPGVTADGILGKMGL